MLVKVQEMTMESMHSAPTGVYEIQLLVQINSIRLYHGNFIPCRASLTQPQYCTHTKIINAIYMLTNLFNLITVHVIF